MAISLKNPITDGIVCVEAETFTPVEKTPSNFGLNLVIKLTKSCPEIFVISRSIITDVRPLLSTYESTNPRRISGVVLANDSTCPYAPLLLG